MKEYKWHEAIESARETGKVFVTDGGDMLEWSNNYQRVLFTRETKRFSLDSMMMDSVWYDKDVFDNQVDWSKVAVDTKILVRDTSAEDWARAYFAKFENGVVHAWFDGKTQFTAEDEDDVIYWRQAKLYKEVDAMYHKDGVKEYLENNKHL